MRLREHPKIVSKRDIFMVDPRGLTVEPGFNVRDLNAPDEQEALIELKEQIRNNGILQPLTVRMRDDKIIVVDGHRRMWAALRLIAEGFEISAIPIIQESPGTNDKERTLMLMTANSGKPLTRLQEAEVVRRLIAFGMTADEIAQRRGRTTTWVRDCLDISAMPAEVQGMVKAGDVSATTAVKEVRRSGEAAPTTLRAAIAEAKADGKAKATPRRLHKPASARTPTPISAPEPYPETMESPAITTEVASHRAIPAGSVLISQDRVREIVEALRPFHERVAAEADFSSLNDNDGVMIYVAYINRASALYLKLTGGGNDE